jgi:hypothetical protein
MCKPEVRSGTAKSVEKQMPNNLETHIFSPVFRISKIVNDKGRYHSLSSVRPSAWRDNLPVFPNAAGDKGDSGSFSKPLVFIKSGSDN